jgi:hypothetical protein
MIDLIYYFNTVRKPRPKARKFTYTKKRSLIQVKNKKPPSKRLAIRKITQTESLDSNSMNHPSKRDGQMD